MLNILIKSLGKSKEDPAFKSFQGSLSLMIRSEGDKMIYQNLDEKLTLTIDQADILIKIEMAAESKWFKLYFNEICKVVTTLINEIDVVTAIGEPTAVLVHPQKVGGAKQMLYNKGAYWLSLKFNHDILESLALLLPSLVPHTIQSNSVPIRLCKG